MARRGASEVTRPPNDDRRPFEPFRTRSRPSAPEAPEEQWVEQPRPRPEPTGPPRRTRSSRHRVPESLTRELGKALGATRAGRAEKTLLDATAALDHDRPRDAIRILKPVLTQAPEVAAVRELAGVAHYHLGRWAEAAAHLEVYVRLTGSVDRHPVLADSYRALGRHARVQELWEELRESSPGADLVTEGRIVAAGSLADQGKLARAIGMLERGQPRSRRSPADHHLRLWYALADLYERAGDNGKARELFSRVAAVDPSLADTVERLQALG